MLLACHVRAIAWLLFALLFDRRQFIPAAHGNRHLEFRARHFSNDLPIRHAILCAAREPALFSISAHDGNLLASFRSLVIFDSIFLFAITRWESSLRARVASSPAEAYE